MTLNRVVVLAGTAGDYGEPIDFLEVALDVSLRRIVTGERVKRASSKHLPIVLSVVQCSLEIHCSLP